MNPKKKKKINRKKVHSNKSGTFKRNVQGFFGKETKHNQWLQVITNSPTQRAFVHQIPPAHHDPRLELQFRACPQTHTKNNAQNPKRWIKFWAKYKKASFWCLLVKVVPVSLISTEQSSQTFSSKRMKETSWGRRPGHVSSACMSSIWTGVDESRANTRRCLRFWLPFSFL